MLTAVLASIPSPSSGEIKLGPLQLRAYGLMIALGVLAGVWLAGRRLEARGAGTREDVSYVALWAVPAGPTYPLLGEYCAGWQERTWDLHAAAAGSAIDAGEKRRFFGKG